MIFFQIFGFAFVALFLVFVSSVALKLFAGVVVKCARLIETALNKREGSLFFKNYDEAAVAVRCDKAGEHIGEIYFGTMVLLVIGRVVAKMFSKTA